MGLQKHFKVVLISFNDTIKVEFRKICGSSRARQEMRTPDPTAALIRSENLALGQTEGGHFYAYHRLFGNFSWLDSELFHFLSLMVPGPIP